MRKFADNIRHIGKALIKLDQDIDIHLRNFYISHVKIPGGDIILGMLLHDQKHVESLFELTNTLFMEQVILKPTRGNT